MATYNSYASYGAMSAAHKTLFDANWTTNKAFYANDWGGVTIDDTAEEFWNKIGSYEANGMIESERMAKATSDLNVQSSEDQQTKLNSHIFSTASTSLNLTSAQKLNFVTGFLLPQKEAFNDMAGFVT